MSVLKTTLAAPSIMRGIFRYLLQAPKQRENREKMTRLLSPDKLSEGKNKSAEHPMFDAALKESIKCGLLIEENEEIAINGNLPEASRHPQTGDKLLPDTLVQLFFASDKEDEDLGRLIAWYLAQDIYDAPGTWKEVEQRVAEQRVAESLDLKISSDTLSN